MGGAPYEAVALILGWAAEHFAELDGACLLDGVDLLTLPLPRYCNVVASMMMRGADNAVAVGSLSEDGRTRLTQMLRDGAPAIPTVEEWGTSREAVANLHAAMALADSYPQG